MNFYIVLGQSNVPISNQLYTDGDIKEMKKLPQSVNWSFVPITVPWDGCQWNQRGGNGHSPYPKDEGQTTIRVPKRIAYQVKQYSVWLSQQL